MKRDWHRIEMSEAPQGHGLASGNLVAFEREDGQWELRGLEAKPLVLGSFGEVRQTVGGQRAANPGPDTRREKNAAIGSRGLTKAEKKVVMAFLDRKSAETKKLYTDGDRLDGLWMGGNDIAHWSNGKIVLQDLGSRAAQTVQRYLKREAPKNWMMNPGPDVRKLKSRLLR